MTKNSNRNAAEVKQQQVIAAQNHSEQFGKTDTEFSLDENVQDAISKSQQYQAQKQQPTYEPNKPF